MSQIRYTKIRRIVVVNDENTEETVSIEKYILEMRKYGAKKAKTVRSARHYLRSIGLEIDRKGVILIKE